MQTCAKTISPRRKFSDIAKSTDIAKLAESKKNTDIAKSTESQKITDIAKITDIGNFPEAPLSVDEPLAPIGNAAPLTKLELENRLAAFKERVDDLINNHPIVTGNAFTAWFAAGDINRTQLRAFTVQFSVFSHLFIEAQLRKCINSHDLQSYRAGKEILMNELGCMFTEKGSIDNGRFRFTAAHFEWLLDFAEHVGLTFPEIGKRKHGTAATLQFCDALMTWYGSDCDSTAAGASHAIEHWAAAGFWKELIAGLKIVKRRDISDLPLGFWVFHDQIEDQHAAHTDDELEAAFAKPDFSEEAFLAGGKAMLDAVAVFWEGLNGQCRNL